MDKINKIPFIALLLTSIAIAYLSLSSLKGLPKIGFSFSDKIGHLIAYLTLGFLAAWAFRDKIESKIVIIMPIILYGFLIEIAQMTLTINRHFEFSDILANIIGCILGVFIFKTIIN